MNPWSLLLLICLFIFVPAYPFAADKQTTENLREMVNKGEYLNAAKGYYDLYQKDKGSSKSAEALAMVGRLLDYMQDKLTEDAEKRCFWTKSSPRTPDCMNRETSDLNKTFGENSFRYTGGEGVAFINYTGEHYRILEKKFKKSPYIDEAEFYLLLKGLIGMPDDVLGRVKGFIVGHKSGYWNRMGNFLLARVNEDIWYVWKKWTWVVYNKKISEDELIVKAEPYRQEALKLFKGLSGRDDIIGKKAASEYQMLNNQEYGGNVYSITNDSSPGTWQAWGVNLLDPPHR